VTEPLRPSRAEDLFQEHEPVLNFAEEEAAVPGRPVSPHARDRTSGRPAVGLPGS